MLGLILFILFIWLIVSIIRAIAKGMANEANEFMKGLVAVYKFWSLQEYQKNLISDAKRWDEKRESVEAEIAEIENQIAEIDEKMTTLLS